MSIAVDSSTPAFVPFANGSATATTASFSPPANSLLVAMYMNGYDEALASAPTNTGTALTWNQLATYSQGGDVLATMLVAYNTSAQTGITVTATSSSALTSANVAYLGVAVLTGASSTQNGPVTQAGGGATATVTTTITRNANSVTGSVGLAAFCTRNTAAPTVTNGSDSFGSQSFVATAPQYSFCLIGPATTDGTTAITLGTSDVYEFAVAAAEILPASSGPTPVNPPAIEAPVLQASTLTAIPS